MTIEFLSPEKSVTAVPVILAISETIAVYFFVFVHPSELVTITEYSPGVVIVMVFVVSLVFHK